MRGICILTPLILALGLAAGAPAGAQQPLASAAATTQPDDSVIGAYWPIKGEFDPLPALHRWKEDGELLEEPQLRRIGLPVIDKQTKTLSFHAWYPGCPMEEDAYGIPKPKDTEEIVPTLLFVPCVGYGPGGYRLGYGGGFYDRTLASLQPRPFTVGLGFTHGYLDDLEPAEHDIPLDAILNDNGVVWPINGLPV